MTKYLLALSMIAATTIGTAQQLWTPVDGTIPLRANTERDIIPEKYETFSVDSEELAKALKDVSPTADVRSNSGNTTIEMPQPDGSIATYTIWEAPVMAPGLAARYPQLKTYKGFNTNRPSEIIRFDLSPDGLRAAIRSSQGQIYIDPYAKGDTKHHIVYYTRDDFSGALPDGIQACGWSPDDIDNVKGRDEVLRRHADGEVVDLRTYRLAMAGAPAWCRARGTVEACMAYVNSSVNRLNLILENEASVHLELIENNDQLMFFEDGVYQNSTTQARLIIGENTQVINRVVGAEAYDIGHVFSNCFDVGGIASLASVCNRNSKGAAVTCTFSNSPTRIAMGTLAHEVGHQFSMNHIFNHCDGENESSGTGWEPGSGSTIMSYAGGCGPVLNVQSDNDDYYNIGNLQEAYNFSRNGNLGDECNTKTVTGNHAPIVSLPYPSNLVIPISTPFELTGEAEDLDGDQMTYTWEQQDVGPLSTRGQPIGNAPLFRSLYPGDSPTRVLPNLQNLTGQISDPNEVLPTTSRDITMVFSARDNHAGGGTASWETLEMRSTEAAGPFLVLFPNLFSEMTVGDEIEVTWDVANTDVAPIGVDKVDIYLSLDGGFTYPYLLASDVPNDGSEMVVLPNQTTIRARVKVKARDHVFFDISNRNFEIVAPDVPTFIIESGVINLDACLPDDVIIELPTVAFNDYQEPITFDVTAGLPDGAIATFDPPVVMPGETTTLTIDMAGVEGTAEYILTLEGLGADGIAVSRQARIATTGTDFSDIATISPIDGLTGSEPLPVFVWQGVPDATRYRLELATNPSFEQSTIVFTRTTSDLSAQITAVLDPSTVYYWRVVAANDCAELPSKVAAFSTEALSCNYYAANNLPRVIGTTTGGINATVFVDQPGQVADVNVSVVRGEHTRVGDIRALLTAPSGKQTILWNPRCATQDDYNLSLDDDAAEQVSCPLTGGKTYRPDGDLSTFIGEEISGQWVLRVEDTRSGNGGTVDAVELEICSNVSLDPPVLVTSDTIPVDRSMITTVEPSLLQSSDNNHSADQLVYTIVERPLYGHMVLGNIDLTVGSQFTQAQIDAGVLRYKHFGGDEDYDAFSVTVADPDGGWVPITTVDIQIFGVVSNEEVSVSEALTIYPNPAREQVTIIADEAAWRDDSRVDLFDLQGRLVNSAALSNGGAQLSLVDLQGGIYIVRISDGRKVTAKRLSVLR